MLRIFMMIFAFLLLLAMPGRAAGQAATAVSSGTVMSTEGYSGGEMCPLSFTFVKTEKGASFETTFNTRWDTSDIPKFLPAVCKFIFSPIKTLASRRWRLSDSAKVNFYGVTVRPGRLFWEEVDIRRGKGRAPGSSALSASENYQRRFRLSLTPVMEDIWDSLDFKKIAINETFKLMGPVASKTNYKGRESFVNDMLLIPGDLIFSDVNRLPSNGSPQAFPRSQQAIERPAVVPPNK